MNPAQLLGYFDRLVDAPDAILRLRRFILDLAVRGKLVAQNPNGESASALIKQIQADKAKLVKIGKIKRIESYSAVSVDESWCEIPSSWVYTRLGAITNIVMGTSPPGSTYNTIKEGVPLINGPAEFTEGPFGITTVNQYTTEPTSFCESGDFLICVRGSTTGRTNIAGFHACIGRGVAAIQPIYQDQFVRLCICSRRQLIIEMGRGIAFPSISRGQLENLVIPFPPLAEQHRIVAKVDELMALCDRLEAVHVERESRRDRLVRASLHRLYQPTADAQTFRAHAHFTLDHLPRLTTRLEHIPQLRQTILNLAVRGRLVPQDPNDEPASELLRLIQVEKTQFLKNGKPRAISPLNTNDTPYLIPKRWVWVQFGDIVFSRDGERIPVSKDERNTRARIYDYYGASGVIDKIDNFLFDKPLLLIGEDGANLINRSTPIAFIARGRYWVNNHAHVLDGISEGFLRFVELHINAIDLKPYVTGTAQPKMNQAKMNSIPIALPPLAEQYRIVAKVDELIALCDRLEAQLTTGRTESGHLLEAVLHEALAPTKSA
jgi:type I restriction enzyme S subunit